MNGLFYISVICRFPRRSAGCSCSSATCRATRSCATRITRSVLLPSAPRTALLSLPLLARSKARSTLLRVVARFHFSLLFFMDLPNSHSAIRRSGNDRSGVALQARHWQRMSNVICRANTASEVPQFNASI